MQTRTITDNWANDATWLIQALDPHARLARLVRMDIQAYRNISFLDDRMLGAGVEQRLVSLDELIERCKTLPAYRGGWIFHIGHVGSTLISRLLGELPLVLPVREPRSLRDLGFFDVDERVRITPLIARAMMRPLSDRGMPIVKATSFVSELAPALVAEGEPCLMLTASPANYVATILAGPNSRSELEALYSQRKERLTSRGIHLADWPMDAAHMAAAAWACEATSLEQAAAELGASAMFQDFDDALSNMADTLIGIASHFGIQLPIGDAKAIVAGPQMRRYSKAQEYDYSPALRRQLLDEATTTNLLAINAALDRLRQASQDAPLLATALARSMKG